VKFLLHIFFVLVLPVSSYLQANEIDSLKTLILKSSSDRNRLRLLNQLADAYDSPNNAIAIANQAVSLAGKLKNNRELAFALNVIADAYIDKSYYSDAINYADKAYQTALKNRDNENISTALLSLGRAYYELNKYNEALKFLYEQEKLIPVIKNDIEVLMCYNTIAMIAFDQGNMKLAHEYYMKELTLAEQKNKKTYIAQAYNNLANVYDIQKKYDKALEYYMKDMQITKLLNDEEGLSTSYNNIGDSYLSLGEYEKAKEFIEKAIEIAERLNYKAGLAIFYNSLATYYQETGDDDKALFYYKKDLENAKVLGNKFNLAESLLTLGDFYLSLEKITDAGQAFSEALSLAIEIKSVNQMGMAYKGLSNVKEKEGNYKEAYYYHKLYKTQYDSIFNIESEKNMSELNARYENEKKEQTIALLNKEKELKNNEIKKQKVIRYSFTIGFILMLGLVFTVFKSYRIKQKANDLLALQKYEIELKNNELHHSKNALQDQKDLLDLKQKEILDSINYAKRIQYTLLANESFLNAHISDHFVVFKPKDIVSGDFYWGASVRSSELGVRSSSNPEPIPGYPELGRGTTGNNASSGLLENNPELRTVNSELFYLAVCDSTGHGVPGAFMSLLNIGFLSEAINEKQILRPDEIFNYVRKRLIENISKEEQKDGFDGVLLCIDKLNKKITYAAANIGGLLVNKNGVTEMQTDKMPVGAGEKVNSFSLFELPYIEGSVIYISTDGYADQFGGPKGKKFKSKQLEQLLVSISEKDMLLQHQILSNRFDEWKGELEQVDDVCLLGIRL
jgi:tetratricopeptide (TPR) repeat protein